MQGERWTDEEIKAIRDTELTARELSRMIDRTPLAIKKKRYDMGISKNIESKYIPPQITMSEQEKEYRIYSLAAKLGIKIQ